MPDDCDTAAPLPPSFPISTAPLVPNQALLLWERGGKHWLLGYWDGRSWCADDGVIISPVAWAPLPDWPSL